MSKAKDCIMILVVRLNKNEIATNEYKVNLFINNLDLYKSYMHQVNTGRAQQAVAHKFIRF